MSDERRHEDRRDEDMRLAAEVSRLYDALDRRFSEEWEQAHAIHDTLAPKDHEHVEVTRLINILEGAPKKMPSGEVRREGGVLSELKILTTAMSNGGVKIKVPRGVWVAVIVAIITGMFNVIVAIIDTSPPW